VSCGPKAYDKDIFYFLFFIYAIKKTCEEHMLLIGYKSGSGFR
jgi:hypothetical protein